MEKTVLGVVRLWETWAIARARRTCKYVKQSESMRPAETYNMLAYAHACVAIWMHS